jgi:hypothetical protein
LGILDHEGKAFYLFSILIAKNSIGPDTDELDKVFMVELLHDSQLFLNTALG